MTRPLPPIITADISRVVVPSDRPVQLPCIRSASELATRTEVSIFKATRRRDNELVSPAVERMQCGEWRLQRARAVAAEVFPAGAISDAMPGNAGFHELISMRKRQRVAGVFMLPRRFQRPAPPFVFLQVRAGPAHAVGCSRCACNIPIVMQA
jgi:hypothetical protein